MWPLIAALSTFLALFLAIAGRRLFAEPTTKPEARLRALAKRPAAPAPSSLPLLRRAPSSLPILRNLLSGGRGERIRRELEQADVRLRPGEYVAVRMLMAIAFFLIGFIVLGRGVGLPIALVLAALGFMLPAFYLRLRTKRRVETIGAQLPQFLSLAANALRAGFALLQAMESAARELEPPISEELEKLLIDTRLGASTDDALRAFAQRVDSYEAKTFATAILIQRSTGGNLAEMLDKIAETMEDRERIRAEVRTFTAQQRLTGNVLAVYPTALGAFFTIIHPGLMSVLWTEPLGIALLIIALSLQLTGFLVIRRLLTVDY
jgi:tight adherence protein B